MQKNNFQFPYKIFILTAFSFVVIFSFEKGKRFAYKIFVENSFQFLYKIFILTAFIFVVIFLFNKGKWFACNISIEKGNEVHFNSPAL